jgi:hypothetical protein
MAEGTILEHDLPDAGWYTDPENPLLQRYWAGDAWTHHVRHSDGVALTTQPTFVPGVQPAPSPSHRSETQFSAIPAFSPHLSFTPQASTAGVDFTPVETFSSPSSFQPMTALSASDSIAIEEQGRGLYVPLSTIHHTSSSSSTPWSSRFSSPSTASVWIIAVSPLLALLSQFVALTIAPAAITSILSLVAACAVLAVLLIAAITDAVILRRRELPSASAAWLLLSPLVFLGVRHFVLRREGFRYVAPLVSFVVLLVLSCIAASYLISVA